MDVAQVRLPKGLMQEVNNLVRKGFYTNKSDVIRDALRRLLLDKQIGSIPNTGDSVKQVRKARTVLSKQIKSHKDLEEINKLGD
jgi:Arc/MetJ-type ribon-helix-helix transcriptional regulator